MKTILVDEIGYYSFEMKLSNFEKVYIKLCLYGMSIENLKSSRIPKIE